MSDEPTPTRHSRHGRSPNGHDHDYPPDPLPDGPHPCVVIAARPAKLNGQATTKLSLAVQRPDGATYRIAILNDAVGDGARLIGQPMTVWTREGKPVAFAPPTDD